MHTPTEQCRMKVSELQRRLAKKATDKPEHRFTKLYDLLTWKPLMEWAFDKLMTNVGSRTAGSDGMDKRTAHQNRDKLIAELRGHLKAGTYRHQPLRRVCIPKSNGKRRPPDIPALRDRLVQLMAKTILEPIFESDFRPESHGFRPGRSCHTAMAQLFQATAPRQKKMYRAVEGAITGRFDRTQHTILMRLLRRRIQDNRLLEVIWQMLRAGVMEGELFKKASAGTPQGGIIAPLLANVYLHEIDEWFHQNYTGLNYNQKNKRQKHKAGNAFYVRYADDFVVAWSGTREGAEQLKAELSTFLRDHLGLELSAHRTRITHVAKGYDFLGFTVKRYEGRGNSRNGLIIRPSETSVMKLKARIKAMTRRGTTFASVRNKIEAMNDLLKGWAHYFRHHASSSTFDYIGSYAFERMEIWLQKKMRQRIRAIYREYYRKPGRYHTWVAGGMALYHPGVLTKIEPMRYTHRPNPYLNTTDEVYNSYHFDPFAGRKQWEEATFDGEGWAEVRAEVLARDRRKCRVWAACHRQARDPQSAVSRQLARMTP